MKKYIGLTLLTIMMSSCASTTSKPNNLNSRLAKQKLELERIGFQVDYLSQKSQNKTIKK